MFQVPWALLLSNRSVQFGTGRSSGTNLSESMWHLLENAFFFFFSPQGRILSIHQQWEAHSTPCPISPPCGNSIFLSPGQQDLFLMEVQGYLGPSSSSRQFGSWVGGFVEYSGFLCF